MPRRGRLPLSTVCCAQTQRPAIWRILGPGLGQAWAVLACTVSSVPGIHQRDALSRLWAASQVPVAPGAPPGRCAMQRIEGTAALRGPLRPGTPSCAFSSPGSAAPCITAHSTQSSPSSRRATLPTASGALWCSGCLACHCHWHLPCLTCTELPSAPSA